MAAKPTSRLSIFHFGKKAKAEKKKLPKQCEICSHKFGLFRKRCQCGKCKTVMCANCSSRKSDKEPRICTKCKPKLVRDPGAAAAAAQRAVRRGARKSKRGEWLCGACGFENERYHAACFACGTLKPKPQTTTGYEPEESSFDPEPSKIESEDEGKVKPEETLDKKDRPSTWWCPNCVFENQGTDANCKICGADKPAFSYLYWACPGCTLANILSNQVCELCSGPRPAIGPELQAAQEAACQADVLLSRDSNLAQDPQTLEERMEAAKRYLKEKKEEEEKAKAEKLQSESTSSETSTSTESTSTESTTTETSTEAPVKKKVKKSVRFGFGGDIPSNPKSSRLAYARSQTLAFKKNKKAPVKGGGGKKHAITLKTEWLEAEMNVNKMLNEWTELNKKTLAMLEVEDAKEEAEEGSTTDSTSTDTSTSTSTDTTTSSTTSTTTTEEEPTGEGVLIMTTPPTETGTESTPSSTAVTPASSLPGSTASSRRGSLVAIEAAGDAPEQQEVFATLQSHYKEIGEEEKEKERQEALKEPTTELLTEPEKEKETEEEGEGESKSISIEEELLGYLDGAKDRLTTFASHSQAYMEGTITAFMYYYMIGKTFGDGQVPVVLPLLLRGLDGHPKRQEALRRYHAYAFKKKCARCAKIVYLPEQILAENRPWHRWCFKCQADDCPIALDLKSFFPFKGKIYCAKHVPKPDPKSNIVY